MKRRITRLPIVQLALVACSLLVGLALAPVAAQTAASLEGQVTVRSDGAVYLITNGVRRWVATVVISDDELNAYPEAEPVYVGLAPFGGGAPATASKPAASTGTANTTPPGSTTPPATASTSASTGSSGSSGSTPAAATTAPDPNAQTKPVGDSCPDDHQVKGATTDGVKTYYEPDRPQYASIKPEVCFTAGSYARDAGYKSSKK